MTRIAHTPVPIGPVVQLDVGQTDDLHIAARGFMALDLWWVQHDEHVTGRHRTFVVVTTGQDWPPGRWVLRGTAMSPPTSMSVLGQFVWHLLEMTP